MVGARPTLLIRTCASRCHFFRAAEANVSREMPQLKRYLNLVTVNIVNSDGVSTAVAEIRIELSTPFSCMIPEDRPTKMCESGLLKSAIELSSSSYFVFNTLCFVCWIKKKEG